MGEMEKVKSDDEDQGKLMCNSNLISETINFKEIILLSLRQCRCI